MDKNTVIGLLLITVIVILFTIVNRPNQEQLAEQRRLQDSIAQLMAEPDPTTTERGVGIELKTAADSVVSQAIEEENHLLTFFSAGAADKSDGSEESSELLFHTVEEDSILTSLAATEEFVALENSKMRLILNRRGGAIKSVQLKEFLRFTGDSLFLFETEQESRFNMELFNRNSVRLSTENELFRPIVTADGSSVIMRLEHSPQQYIDFVYTLSEDDYMMDFDIRIVGMRNGLHPVSLANLELYWEQKVRQQEKGRAFENRYSRIHYKYFRQDDYKMSESKSDSKELTEPVKWFAFKDQYFSAIIIGKQPLGNTILSSDLLTDEDYIKSFKAEVWVPAEMSSNSDLVTAGFNYYFGPVHYNTLKAYDNEVANSVDKLKLEEIVSLGYKWLSWVNKWFVIPLFNFFLSLKWNMGVIIVILTLLVKLIISPLTYKSYISSAKMRVLRPQIQDIEKKYPGKDQDVMMKKQQATMDLYSKAGVSPMSGCLPMFIQMPVLLALFFFFPSAIELRQQSFLWAEDLSTYDSILSWSANIPIISRFLGDHISLFCLLMTATNVIYAKHNMSSMDTGQQGMAGMKYMPIFMSVFMFFFLNSYPSGLNFYYFLSTLITIIITMVMKKVINEEKILIQLEENSKKKSKKKSGFMARLEEAQKMQAKQAREQAKRNAKRR